MSGISSTIVADRLLELERGGLISKKIYPEIPPKVEYRITPQALQLEEVLKELAKWAIRWKGAQTPRVAVKRAQFTSNA